MLVRRASILLAWFPLAGCGTGASNSAAIAPPATRAELLAEAQTNYSYGEEREPIAVDTTLINAPGGVLPTITIASATRSDSTGRFTGSRIFGRLTSSGAYSRLGIAPGINYLWRDSLGAGPEKVRTLVIPADTTYQMFWLQHEADRTPLAPGADILPRLVKSVRGYGACNSGCSEGHCRMIQTSGSFSITADTTRIRTF
ncbi:MAG: hypothetical protein ABIP93_14210 [Gemmatimonadaceae bacterium]